MPSSSDTLHFSLPAHGDSVLHKMNTLREEHRFCDITLILGGPNTSVGHSVHFHGHRVVFAASSDFLRDQFLLHEDQAEMSVTVVSSAKVAQMLLLSCYTGLLEVPLAELVSYLTAASALQMGEVVDKCTQAVSQYLKPTMFLDKLVRRSKETEDQEQERNWPCSHLENQREKDVVQPSTSIQEDKTKEEGAVLSQAMYGVSQESEVESENTGETTEDRKFIESATKSLEDQKLNLDTLRSEENGENTTAALKDEDFQAIISLPAFETGSTAGQAELLNISLIQQEQGAIEEIQYKNSHALKVQHGGDPVDPRTPTPSGAHLTAGDVREASHTIQVQRPYLCRRCGKIFQHTENYVAHLKEHRHYSCLVCGEGFSQKSKLTHHLHIHPDIKPFRCPLCHVTFVQKGFLQEHLHLHTGRMYTLNPAYKPGLRGLKSKRELGKAA